jgi:hypothetical protein
VTLPSTLSGLLTLAVRDAKAVSKLKRYRLDMWSLHTPQGGATYVCMAGAVMARTLKADRKTDCGLDIYGRATRWRLFAIEYMRIGEFDIAARNLGLVTSGDDTAALGDCIEMVSRAYRADTGRAPWRVYLRAAALLKKAGL